MNEAVTDTGQPLISSQKKARRERPEGRFFFCNGAEWAFVLFWGLVLSGFAFPWYYAISPWIGVTLFLMVATGLHMGFASRFIVPFPHIAILIAGLQYVLAAWLSFYYPAEDPLFNIGERMPVYLGFGAGAVIASLLGWGVTLQGQWHRHRQLIQPSRQLLAELDMLLWFGLGCGVLARFISSGGLAFLLLLCANLRYLGAFGRMLVQGEGWRWRVLLTLLVEMLLATQEGMFHALTLWTVSAFAIYLYRFNPRRSTIAVYLLVGVLLLPAMQNAKWKLRHDIWGEEDSPAQGQVQNVTGVKVPVLWLTYLAEAMYQSVTFTWDNEFLADTAERYNQGWIIDKVMQYVPAMEPYARGETLLTAAEAAVLPRVFAPDKIRAGGRGHMERFAGVTLTQDTSMNLGYAGELYANFGYQGAIVGCFVYAGLLGLAFRWLARRAANNSLWWVFIPYVGCYAFKAEEGIAEILNWMVKASMVAVAVYFCFPAIRASLSAKSNPANITLSSASLRRNRRNISRGAQKVRAREGTV